MSAGMRVAVDRVEQHFATRAGTVRALDGVTVDVPPGGALAVTGPSGCGKSTLLALMGGLERPSGGRVSIDGVAISELSAARRASLRRTQIGFVFQADNLQPYLTAIENVALARALAGCDDGEETVELLRSLGLRQLAERLPDSLSGGERQRVAVARALVHRPRLVLADEPTGSLDGDNARAVIDLLMSARQRTGATLVVITHDESVAARFERRLALRDGRVAGPAAALEVAGA